jgi:hypothetical protein
MGIKGLAAYLRKIQKVGPPEAGSRDLEGSDEDISDELFEGDDYAAAIPSIRENPPVQRRGVELSVLPAGSVLVIDGSGFLFYVLEACGESGAALLGGDYNAFSTRAKREIKNLTQMGLRIEFFFDGEADIFKDMTQVRRAEQRETMWFELYTSCRDRKLTMAHKDLPLPPLLMDQLKEVLRADFKSVGVTHCEGEADHAIATYVKRKNGGRPIHECPYYCYGRDRYRVFL